ncbi:MAG: LysR family transcriptional regulator [Parasphingorhabdus sp.]
MTYEQLLTLHAIVTEGTFRSAADKLNKSQSAVSHMLKKLELEIDLSLLSREEYRPKLTHAGEVFYRYATRVIQEMQELRSVAEKLNAKQEAEVHLTVTATYPLPPILELIGPIKAEYPATHIRLSRESMGGAVERLLRDDADIIIATMDGVPVNEVEAVPFADVTIMPVAHPNLEPAKSKHMKTISDMQSHTQVVVAHSGSEAFSQSRDILPGGLRWTVSDFAAKKEILLAGLGWGGIPIHMIEDELRNGTLVPLNVEGYQPRQSNLFQIRRRDKGIGIVAETMWQRMLVS